MQTFAKGSTPAAARTQGGLSLVELMISMTIGLVLLMGFTALLVRQSDSRDELEKSSRQIENGRYAMQLLHDDIEHAGFYGDYAPDASVILTLPADPCSVAFGAANSGWDNNPMSVPLPLYGFLGGPVNPLPAGNTCGLANYQPGTAVLVVRRVTTDQLTTASPAFTATATYLQVSGCNSDNNVFFVYGTGAAGNFALRQNNCVALSALRPYEVNVYYIASCDICGTDNIPTLKLVQIGPTGVPTTIPLVEGIENMQFDYGLDTSGDGAPDTFVAALAPTDITNWQNVMAVRVSLLARNIDPTTGYADTKTYDLGSAGTVACGVGVNPQPCNYKRHLYKEEIRLVNPSGRRELP